MKIIILSNGPGLKEIVNLYGHSSEWIPNSITHKNISFKVIGINLAWTGKGFKEIGYDKKTKKSFS